MLYTLKRIFNSNDPVIVKAWLEGNIDPHHVYEFHVDDNKTHKIICTQLEYKCPGHSGEEHHCKKNRKLIYFKRIGLPESPSINQLQPKEDSLSTKDLIEYLNAYLNLIEASPSDRFDRLVIRLNSLIYFPGSNARYHETFNFIGLLIINVNKQAHKITFDESAKLYLTGNENDNTKYIARIFEELEKALKNYNQQIKLQRLYQGRILKDHKEGAAPEVSYYSYLAITNPDKLNQAKTAEELRSFLTAISQAKTVSTYQPTERSQGNKDDTVAFSEEKIEGIENEINIPVHYPRIQGNPQPQKESKPNKTPQVNEKTTLEKFPEYTQHQPLSAKEANKDKHALKVEAEAKQPAAITYQKSDIPGAKDTKITITVTQKDLNPEQPIQSKIPFLQRFKGQIIYLSLLSVLALFLSLLVYLSPLNSPVINLLGPSGMLASFLNITAFTMGLNPAFYALLLGGSIMAASIFLLGFYLAITTSSNALDDYLYPEPATQLQPNQLVEASTHPAHDNKPAVHSQPGKETTKKGDPETRVVNDQRSRLS